MDEKDVRDMSTDKSKKVISERTRARRRKKKIAKIRRTCIFILIFILIGVSIALIKNHNDGKPPKGTESGNKTEISTTDSETEITSESDTEKETTTEKESETKKPTSTTSFYKTVKYRSPDAVTANIFKHGRNLMLLNRKYELPEDFQWDLVYWSNGNPVDAMYLNCEERNSVQAVDKAAYQPLKNMFAAASKDGVPLQLVSAYRSIYLQDKLFTRSVNSYMSQGFSEADAINKANYSRTFSGTSEHNTGLGFDILEQGNYSLSESFENTAQFKWLMENAEDYGFVLRYPKDKIGKTGIMYEPWHFRYVGVKAAKEMNQLGLCLEEYIEYLEA